MMGNAPIAENEEMMQRLVAGNRAGSLVIALLLGLSVLVGFAALALDWAYVSIVESQLQRAADAAALSAAHELADERTLLPRFDPAERMAAGVAAACRFGLLNPAGGEPTIICPDSWGSDGGSDIEFGVLDRDSGRFAALAFRSSRLPDTVRIVARRCRQRSNPVAMLLGHVLGVTEAEVGAVGQATIEDRVVGFAPVGGSRVPLAPVAVLASSADTEGGGSLGWLEAIERRSGQDLFGFDRTSGRPVRRSDGLPEMELKLGDPAGANACLIELAAGRSLVDRFERGYGPDDLARFGGRLPVYPPRSLSVRTATCNRYQLADALARSIGKPLVWLLYQRTDNRGSEPDRVAIAGAVAARIIHYRQSFDGETVIRVQPTVIVTRTAVTEEGNRQVPRNKYIKRIVLSG
jgi:hypothetical protein